MTDKIKERFYTISHCRCFHEISLIILLILFELTFLLKLIIDVPVYRLTNCISVILALLFFVIQSFKRYDLKTIKKNKIMTIILSYEDCVLIPLYALLLFFINLINSIFNSPLALDIFLIILLSIIITFLSTKISNHYKARIIQ